MSLSAVLIVAVAAICVACGAGSDAGGGSCADEIHIAGRTYDGAVAPDPFDGATGERISTELCGQPADVYAIDTVSRRLGLADDRELGKKLYVSRGAFVSAPTHPFHDAFAETVPDDRVRGRPCVLRRAPLRVRAMMPLGLEVALQRKRAPGKLYLLDAKTRFRDFQGVTPELEIGDIVKARYFQCGDRRVLRTLKFHRPG